MGINEYFYAEEVDKNQLDELLNQAWRHFGHYFFRYSSSDDGEKEQTVVPLRIELARFQLSKSQRKILKKNADFDTYFRPAFIDEEKEDLFFFHKQKFSENRPANIYNFLSENPAKKPTQVYEVAVYNKKNELVAVSFVDISSNCFSSIYAMYLIRESYAKYSLGIFTLLKEIEFAKEMQKDYLHLGYAYSEASFYDYKKGFSALQAYDWEEGIWKNFKENP